MHSCVHSSPRRSTPTGIRNSRGIVVCKFASVRGETETAVGGTCWGWGKRRFGIEGASSGWVRAEHAGNARFAGSAVRGLGTSSKAKKDQHRRPNTNRRKHDFWTGRGRLHSSLPCKLKLSAKHLRATTQTRLRETMPRSPAITSPTARPETRAPPVLRSLRPSQSPASLNTHPPGRATPLPGRL